MAYEDGGQGPGYNGYWRGHHPPNSNTYGNGTQDPSSLFSSVANGSHSQHDSSTNNAHLGQGPYWGQNRHLHYTQERVSSQPGAIEYHTTHPASVQPQPPAQQPQFVNPAQLFQQPAQDLPLQHYNLSQQTSQVLSSAVKPAVRSAPVQIDKPMLLMSLAEEFFNAAHELAPSAALSLSAANIESYEKLIATGLGCLDTALRHVRLSPRVEANMRLRYAGVLFEETENFMEAETALSKGIALCERNHYFDIKYAMQFLLAQFMFKKNPKASMKALDAHISDAQTYQHYSWVYALRFLRASNSLESSNPADAHAAIQNFRAIADLASEQSDRAIYFAVSLMEAMAHLKSNGPDSMEQAQRAIAAAWSYQLDSGTKIPQLISLAHILDVTCSIRQGNPNFMIDKLRDMQTMMDGALKDRTWSTTSDNIAIPINRTQNSSQVVSPDTRMIIGIGDDGRDILMMSFLSKKDAYAITYLLCGIVLLHKNSSDQKSIKYLETGLASLEGDIRTYRASSGLLPDYVSKLQWRGQLLCYFHNYLAFCAAAVADWASTKRYIDKLRATATSLEVSLSGPLGFLALYLTGIYHQGIGDLDAALHIFQDARFDLSQFKGSQLSSEDQVGRDIALLAALNTLWILQDPDRQHHTSNSALLSKLQDICGSHPNKDIETAFNLVMATVNTNPPAPLYKIKSYLRAALSGAQETCNTQFLCITLNIMCSRFFANVVGAQAEKSAMAASVQAKKNGNVLWRSVAEGLLAQCYTVNGKTAEAQFTLDQAQRLAQIALPDS